MKLANQNIFSVDRYYDQAARTGSVLNTVGFSNEGRPILSLKKGTGPIKILVLARLHGNEPAPSQAVLDFFKNYEENGPVEMYGVFLANPDGAANYEKYWLANPEPDWKNSFEKARLNAVEVDLNRDWLALTQPETQSLQKFIFSLRPDLVLDLHEYYWKEGFPPKNPIEEEDGFLATMTDCPFYLVHESISNLSERLMDELSDHLWKEFKWKAKLRHFIGDKHDTYENPAYLGIYLALRGIPKLLVETWGVACSTLLIKERIAYHRKAIEYVKQWALQNKDLFKNIHETTEEIEFELREISPEKKEKFTELLAKHGFQFDLKERSIIVRCLTIETGFVKTIYFLSIN
ncbi:M14 family zinc carboxypeptidase [Caldithrix abyssi]